MAIGIEVTKAEVNSAAGTISRSIFHAMLLVDQFYDWFGSQTDQNLTDLGFAAGEITQLRAAMDDASDLLKVFRGQATTATLPKNFRTSLKKCLGTGLY